MGPLILQPNVSFCVEHVLRFNKLHEHRLRQLKENGIKLQVHKGAWVLFDARGFALGRDAAFQWVILLVFQLGNGLYAAD